MTNEDDKEIFYFNYTSTIAHELKKIFPDDLVSVVVFGSAARGEARMNDNIDVLIVVEKFEKVGREKVIDSIEDNLKMSEEYFDLVENDLSTNINPLCLTQSEIEKNPSLIKDVIPDGFMIYDTDDFMEDNLRPPRKKRKKSKK
ncbi:MAG: nucleotidyltransferase domain-containing protein [Candidatus Methanoperedens sp.]|nr:nucleotidyltransferase domain-containing protein [Candidatus Methanoperedens sp.]